MGDETAGRSARAGAAADGAPSQREADASPGDLPGGVDRVDDETGARVVDLAALERADAARPWTIDLDAPHVSPRDHAGRRGVRTWQAVAALATLLALAAGLVAGVTARRGEQWRQIAVGQREQVTALEAQVAAATAAVAAAEQMALEAETARRAADARADSAESRFSAQEQDVIALEERLAALAAEKARLEDRLVVAGEARQLTSSADAALVGCVQQVESWLGRAPAEPVAGGEVDDGAWVAWSSQAADWRAACSDALAAVRD